MKTMLEVLADHQQWVSGSCGLEDECDCGFELGGLSIASHQADMLRAAGFGLLAEADKDYLALIDEME